MDFAIGGIGVAVLIMGIVEAMKQFGVEGKGSQALALGLGFFFVGLAYGISEALIPELYVPYIVWFVTSLAGALAAMGYYDFAKRLFINK